MLRNLLAGFTLLAGLALLGGCSQKLTYERWQTLTLQSDKSEVKAVLGTPNKWEKQDAWMYHDSDRQVTVNVEFVGGDTVTYTRWIDPDHGVHEIGTSEIEGGNLMRRETSKTDINP
jgi:hypothetical protein